MPRRLKQPLTVIFIYGCLSLFCSSAFAKANSCFLQAEAYYEQIYCEIKAKDPASSLPSFIDFKKNPPKMQALLLKRKAQALGIDIVMPKKQSTKTSATQPQRSMQTSQWQSQSCQLTGTQISCPQASFIQTGNISNKHLEQHALSDNNRLRLKNYQGSINDKHKVIQHLTTEYTTYLEKMLAIGLGGATMSFTKFYTLFHDLKRQGVDFAKRFETMYQYLKQDKKALGVSEKVEPLAGIDISHCARLSELIFTCDNRTRNTIYLKQ